VNRVAIGALIAARIVAVIAPWRLFGAALVAMARKNLTRSFAPAPSTDFRIPEGGPGRCGANSKEPPPKGRASRVRCASRGSWCIMPTIDHIRCIAQDSSAKSPRLLPGLVASAAVIPEGHLVRTPRSAAPNGCNSHIYRVPRRTLNEISRHYDRKSPALLRTATLNLSSAVPRSM